MNGSKNDIRVFSNIIWRFGQVFGANAVSFVVSIILARLLEPEVYGTVAIVTVFVSVLQVFVDGGLGLALVQKKDADQLDFSTVFYFNVLMCAALYVALFLAAPQIAVFYDDPVLKYVVRAQGLLLPVHALKCVQQSYVARNFLFRKMFCATLAGNVGGAIVGIVMASMGFGVWALVGQMLFNSYLDTAILWLVVKWRPKAQFSTDRLKILFAYGWKLLVTNLVDSIYNNICSLIIGKRYSESQLAYYHRGKQFPTLASYIFSSSMDSVLLPAMSGQQDDRARVGGISHRALSVSSYIMWPVAVGLSICAEPVIELLLTEKWLPCVPYLRVFCVVCAFQPMYTASLNALKAIGRSDLFMKLELAKKILGLALILISMRWGVLAMAFSELVTIFISHIINSFPNRKYLNYGYIRQLRDMLPSMLLSAVMGLCVLAVQSFTAPGLVSLAAQVFAGIVSYILFSALFRPDGYEYLVSMVKRLMFKKNT